MNKNITLTILAFALTGVGIAGGYWFANQRMSHVTSTLATTTTDGEKSDKKPLYYYDPMVPQQRFDKPGKSPFMDMMLVPVYADDGADAGGVRIDARTVQNLGVRTAEVTFAPMDRKLELAGAISFDERAVAFVQARVNGYIEKLFVRAPLDRVTQGQPLAEILAPDWVAAQEEYLALKNSPQANDSLRAAARQRLTILGMPDATIAALDRDGKSRARITISAPISGVVGELAVREGMTVAPGAMLFRLNGLSTVWANIDIPETQVAWLKPGSAIEASVPAYPGDVFKGRVVALLPDVNASTRTLKGRVELANPQGRLSPGMFVTVHVASANSRNVLQVPSEAVIQTGKRTVVILAIKGEDGKQQFTPTDIETAVEANGMTEILRGLSKGQTVVLSGQFLIDSEASLKTTGARMADATPTHHGEGRVEFITKDGVTISHGPIPSMKMGAMTMEFKAPATGVPANVKVGSHVSFELANAANGEMMLTKITPKDGSAK